MASDVAGTLEAAFPNSADKSDEEERVRCEERLVLYRPTA